MTVANVPIAGGPAARLLALVLAAGGAGCCEAQPSRKPTREVAAPSSAPVPLAQPSAAVPSAVLAPHACPSTEPILVSGHDTGFATCGRTKIRPSARECPSSVPRPTKCELGGGSCTHDAECKGPNEYCGWDGGVPAYHCQCVKGCRTDADCPSDSLCSCREPGQGGIARPPPTGTCIRASCRTDADCAPGLCLESRTSTMVGVPRAVAFACTTAADECHDDGDCTDPLRRLCVLQDAVRRCRPVEGIGGRPLLVEAAPRVAEPVATGDWL